MLDRILGDRTRLPFDLVLSLRSQFLHRRVPTILAILALAASAALASSVEMAVRSGNEALAASVNALVGSTQIEITAAELGVEEEWIDRLRSHPGIASASPVIQKTFRLVRDDRSREAIHVVGIDMLYDREVREYGVQQSGFVVRDHARLVAHADSIIISEKLSARLGVAIGDQLRLRETDREFEVTVRGLLVGELALAFGGQIAIMDVFALQKNLAMPRVVGRIDLSLEQGVDLDAAVASVQGLVGNAATARRSILRDTVVAPTLGAFGFGTRAIASIGILLSLFLTYAVISIQVERRVVEFALLRAAGLEAKRVSVLVVLDALVLSAIGSLVGLAAAGSLANVLVERLSSASQHLQEISVAPAPMSALTVALAFLAIPVALLASLEPARRASLTRPLEVLQSHSSLGGDRDSRRVHGIVALVALLLTWIAVLETLPVSIEARLGIAIVSGVVCIAALVSVVLYGPAGRLEALTGRFIPRIGYLVGASFGDRRVETGATVAIWAAITGGVFALFTGLTSLSQGLDEFFVGLIGTEAVVAFSDDPDSASRSRRMLMGRDLVTRIGAVPGVVDAIGLGESRVIFRDQEVLIEEEATRVLLRHGGMQTISADPEQSVDALLRGEALVSGAFSDRFDVHPGDEIELPTMDGPKRLRIGGYARSFVGTGGSIHLDSEVFRKWFIGSAIGGVIFWVDRPVEQVIASIEASIGDQPLFFRHGDAYRKQSQRVVSRMQAILLIPVAVMALIGLVGLGNVLAGNLAARRREFALIRATGGTPESVLGVTVLGGISLAILGIASGCVLGVIWSHIVVEGTGQYLGWKFEAALYPKLIVVLFAVGIGCAALVSAIPGYFMGRRTLGSSLAER